MDHKEKIVLSVTQLPKTHTMWQNYNTNTSNFSDFLLVLNQCILELEENPDSVYKIDQIFAEVEFFISQKCDFLSSDLIYLTTHSKKILMQNLLLSQASFNTCIKLCFSLNSFFQEYKQKTVNEVLKIGFEVFDFLLVFSEKLLKIHLNPEFTDKFTELTKIILKITPDLLLNYNLDIKEVEEIVQRVKKFDLPKEKLQIICQDDFLKILEKFSVVEKNFLDAFFPRFLEIPDLIDLKHMLKFVFMRPLQIKKAFEVLLRMFHSNENNTKQTSHQQGDIFLTNQSETKELAFFMRFSVKDVKINQTIIKFIQQDVAEIVLKQSGDSLILGISRLDRNSSNKILEFFVATLKPSEPVIISYSHSLSIKNFLIRINEKEILDKQDLLKSFERLNRIKFSFEGTLDYILVYNQAKAKLELQNFTSHYSLLFKAVTEKLDLANHLVFIVSSESQNFYPADQIKLPEKGKNLFDLFNQLGGLNCIIPILKQSYDSSDFAELFNVLTDFSVSMKKAYLNELFSEDFFRALRILMGKNVLQPCSKLVKSLKKFILLQSDLQILQIVIENILINCDLWAKVEDNCVLISTFNIFLRVDSGLYDKLFKEPIKLYEMVKFFVTVKQELFVRSFLFRILDKIIGNFASNHEALLEIMKIILDNMNSAEEGQHFFSFLKKVSENWNDKSKKHKLQNFESILVCNKVVDDIFPLIKNGNELDYAVISFVLDVFSNHIQKYKFDTLTGRIIDFKISYSKEVDFYNKLYDHLEALGVNISKEEIIELFFNFSEKGVIKQVVHFAEEPTRASMLNSEKKCPFFFDLVTNQLYNVFTKNDAKFKDIILMLKYLIRNNVLLSKRIVESSSFPGWSYKFFENNEKSRVQDFFEFFLGIFTLLDSFKNLNALRKLIFYFKDSKVFNSGLDFLLWILNNELFEAGIIAKQVFFIDILNIFEDISLEYDTSTNVYLAITEKLVSLSKVLGENYFSLSFPKITTSQTIEAECKEDLRGEKMILFRDGGIARQLLLFIFNSMKWKRSQILEDDLIYIFTHYKLTPKPIELKKLKSIMIPNFVKKGKFNQDTKKQYIRKAKLPGSKSKASNFENLILIYTYFEWNQCIFNYSNEDKKASEMNLRKFIEKIDFKTKLKILDPKKNKYLKLVLTELKSLKMTPEFKELFNLYRVNLNPNELDKYLEELSELLIYKKNNLKQFVIIDKDDFPLDLLMFYLTSLKLNFLSRKLSVKYFKETYEQKTANPSLIRTRSSVISSSFINNYQVESEQIFKRTLKRYSDIFQIHKVESLKFSLRGLSDSLGRRVFIHKNSKKYKENDYRKRSFDTSTFIHIKKVSSNKTDYTDIDRSESYAGTEESNNEVLQVKPTIDSLEVECEIINIYGSYYGSLFISEKFILFQCKSKDKPELGPLLEKKIFRASISSETQLKEEFIKLWKIEEIQEIIPKRFLHVNSAIEVFFYSGKSKYLNFFTENKCQIVKSALAQYKAVLDIKESKESYLKDWRIGKISNFEYLLALNKLAGRSFNDLSQYPIFPWVLKNYQTDEINLADASNYRDLSLPVACQENYGQEKSKKTYEISKSDEKYPYHHGSHYSNGGIVLHFMIRIEPFTLQSKNLQGGAFDVPDRLFLSLEIAWKSTQSGYGDCKELIPDLFYLPEIFLNKNNEEFNRRQNGHLVDGILLPAWAKNSVYKFLHIHRKALESQVVSEKLHFWINLIFGSHQDGEEGRKSLNLFHPVTYDKYYRSILMNFDKNYHHSLSQQVQHFGQTPIRLFDNPHKSKQEVEVKETLAEKLLNNKSLRTCDLTQNFCGKILINCNYLVIVHKSSCVIKLNLNEKQTERNEFSLKAVKEFECFLAGLTDNDRLVTCEKLSNCVSIHSLSGELLEKIRIFSSKVTCLAAGTVIAVGCIDSSLTVIKENSIQLRLFGHLQSINDLVISEVYCSVISATFESILIHDYRSGDVLTRIQNGGLKLSCNNFGCICVENTDELSFWYINGDKIREKIAKKIDWWVLVGDCILFSTGEKKLVADVYWDEEPKETQQKIEVCSELVYNEKSDVLVWFNKNNELLRTYL